MISAREASQGLYGAWLLAHFDEDGILQFENTPGAALLSFKAALLALPVHVVLVLLQTDWDTVAGGGFGATMIHAITFVADWTAFPLAMFYIARLIRRDQWFWRYLAAYNWAQVLQITLYLAVSAIVASGLLPVWLGGLMTFAVVVAIFVYKGFIARVGLEVSMPGTVGIVLLDVAISLVLSGIMINLLTGHGLLGG